MEVDSFEERQGDIWLAVTTIVTDPQDLNQPFITSTHFKKLPNASGWDPTPCRVNEVFIRRTHDLQRA
jgi:hypothetical protein